MPKQRLRGKKNPTPEQAAQNLVKSFGWMLVFGIVIGGLIFLGTELWPRHSRLNEDGRMEFFAGNPDEPLDDGTAEARGKIRDDFIKNGEKIAKESGEPLAATVMDFVKKSGVLAIPIALQDARAQKIIEAPEGDKWFVFVPLLPQDARIDAWLALVKAPAAAHFLPDKQVSTLVLKPELFNPSWQGIIMLHEGHHAYQYINEKYDWANPRIFCQKERETHEFQNRVVRAVAGARYDVALEREVRRIQGVLIREGKSTGTIFPDRGRYESLLDDLFGKCASQLEEDTRQTHFWIHAMFLLIDREVSGVAVQNSMKDRFLSKSYKEGGIIPK